jgi:sugar lactone lactonase YvrE
MNYRTVATCLILLAICTAHSAASSLQGTPRTAWEASDGIQAPESVYYDSATRQLYVSNIGAGGPTGKDGDGFLSKLDLDGNVIALKWVTGLNAPKGMRVHGDTLWVSDIDHLVAIDIAKGKILTRIPIPGATFLNDVACAADGTVFVSDTLNSRILRCRSGKPEVFVAGGELECPNGLLVLGNRLIVAAWGRDPADDFSTKVPGRLYSIDLESKQLTPISDQPTGNHDGLESDGSGGFFTTDWVLGKIMHIAADGSVKRIAQSSKGTADLAYVPEKKMLVIPHMMENKVLAIPAGDGGN